MPKLQKQKRKRKEGCLSSGGNERNRTGETIRQAGERHEKKRQERAAPICLLLTAFRFFQTPSGECRWVFFTNKSKRAFLLAVQSMKQAAAVHIFLVLVSMYIPLHTCPVWDCAYIHLRFFAAQGKCDLVDFGGGDDGWVESVDQL